MTRNDRDAFYPKYRVIRRSTGEELDATTTFTLVPSRDPAAVEALKTYADAVERELPGLARDIREKLINPNLGAAA